MQSFEMDIHGPDEEVGLYKATIRYHYGDVEGSSEVVHLTVTIDKKEDGQMNGHSTMQINYPLDTKEYIPLSGAETNDLYGSVILMLDETFGNSWGTQ